MTWTLARWGAWLAFAAVALYVAVNVTASVGLISWAPGWPNQDWWLFTEAGSRIVDGSNPYVGDASTPTFRWSPVIALFFAAIAPFGPMAWNLVGFAMLALLRDWRIVLAFLVSWPFWIDIATGLSFAYVPVLTIVALRGSFAAGLGLAAILVLVPRPMMLPIVAFILWKQPRLRLPAFGVIGVLLAASFATGWADEWLEFLLVAGTYGENAFFAPSHLFGPLWLVMVPLAAWLTLKGHVGLAALAISPYWTPSYLLMLLVEFVPRWSPGRGRSRTPRMADRRAPPPAMEPAR